MPEYLIELYLSRPARDAVIHGAQRARRAADQLRIMGTPVRYQRSIFVPEDETWFLFYEAASAEHVRQAARLAGIPAERIVQAFAAEADAP